MRQRIVSAFKSRRLSLTLGTLLGIVTVPVLLLGTVTFLSAAGAPAPDDPTPDPTPQPDPNYTDFVAPAATVTESRNLINLNTQLPVTTPGVPYQNLPPVNEAALIAKNNTMMPIGNALMDAPDDVNMAPIRNVWGTVRSGYWRVPQAEPPNIGTFITSRTAAIQLGKALFWDMQVGSDGIQACASCHFQAGADRRLKNQLNSAQRAVNGVNDVAGHPDIFFNQTASGASGGPNYTLTAYDFPFYKLSDPGNRLSSSLFETNDISGSQGVFNTQFSSIDATPNSSFDNGLLAYDPNRLWNNNPNDPFMMLANDIGKIVSTRQTTARNSPSVINATFNYRNFWDGRARNIFNGFNIAGEQDPNAVVLQVVNNSRYAGAVWPLRTWSSRYALARAAL